MNAVTPFPAPSSSAAAALGVPVVGPNIGEILVAAGRLSRDSAHRIVQHQQRNKLPFGEAAKELKLLTQDDIDFALSQQFDYAYLRPDQTSLSTEVVAAFRPFSRVGENLRALRSQLQLRWLIPGKLPRALAIVSPHRNEGRTFVAANLAVVFAQQGQQTLLIDANLRQPRQGQLFRSDRKGGLGALLADRDDTDAIQTFPELPGLHVLPAGQTPPNPQELLSRPSFEQLLRNAVERFDVVLVDTPAANEYADAELIASRAGCGLLLARENQTQVAGLQQLAMRLQDNGVAVLGTALNSASD